MTGRRREPHPWVAEALPAPRRRAVQAVCANMWQPVVQSVREHVPHARIVHDNFHVLRHANNALDEIGRAAWPSSCLDLLPSPTPGPGSRGYLRTTFPASNTKPSGNLQAARAVGERVWKRDGSDEPGAGGHLAGEGRDVDRSGPRFRSATAAGAGGGPGADTLRGSGIGGAAWVRRRWLRG